jgi:hypothetical protein
VTLKRELREELELDAEIVELIALEKPHPTQLDLAYACHPLSAIGVLCGELLGYRWAAPSELPPLRPFHQQAIAKAASLPLWRP